MHLPLNLPERWRGFFRECFPARSGEILRYRGPTGYRDALASHPMLPLVSPHPFDSAHCPAERWYLADPGLAVRLNDKGRLAEMTDPQGGGDGVVLCHRERYVKLARRRFAGRQVKVERLVEAIRQNFNVQLRVTQSGGIEYISGSIQQVDSGRYFGNSIDPDWLPPPTVADVCDQAARAAAALGWQGVCGLDLIEEEGGEVWLIDPNFRLNGTTPFFLLDGAATRRRAPKPDQT